MQERTRAELDAMIERMARQVRRALSNGGVELPEAVIREVAMRATSALTVDDLRYSLWVREQAECAVERAGCEGEA